MARNGRVLVAMSGGVDSSVAAALLHEQGYDVVGVFMRTGIDAPPASEACSVPLPMAAPERTRGCCSASDAADARAVAGRLGVPFYALNFRDEFERLMIDFADEYVRGRTPNPCVRCNQWLKFGKLAAYAGIVDAEWIATGHYAIIRHEGPGSAAIGYRVSGVADQSRDRKGAVPDLALTNQHSALSTDSGPGSAGASPSRLGASPSTTAGREALSPQSSVLSPCDSGPRLFRARDRRKDQSYVLFGVAREVLARTLFPLGELTKAEVRREAARLGLALHDKPESQDICFVPDRDYVKVVNRLRPGAMQAGEIRHADGRIVGRHEGVGSFTIGQRRGVRVAVGEPVYVTALDPDTATVTVGPKSSLAASGLLATEVNWLNRPAAADETPDDPVRAHVQIRYHHDAAPAWVRDAGDSSVEVTFDHPVEAVTPGQAAVFYSDDEVLGGGWIERGLDGASER